MLANLVLGFLGWVGFAVYFGGAGNDLAWRNRPFGSLQQFRDTERVWAWWGLGVSILSLLLVGAIVMVILMPLLMRTLHNWRPV